MTFKLSTTLLRTGAPPIMDAFRWLEHPRRHIERSLLNLSQAAPSDPPPKAIRDELARLVVEDASVHLYGPVLGLQELRARVANHWSSLYQGDVSEKQVAITSGCNQAFCAAIAAVAAPGDAVILPTPFYFNHRTHLTTMAVTAELLPVGPDMLPNAKDAARRITSKTRAIVLVTPNNPSGAEYPAELISEFADLARASGIALILDETYRDFHADEGPPHHLFARSDWADVLIHLYSFSKVFRLTGHRVGAILAARRALNEVEKYLDNVTICANQLAQRAALFGLETQSDWVAMERAEILHRRASLEALAKDMPHARLRSSGAYFGYFEIEHALPSDEFAQAFLHDQSVLILPGTFFAPRRVDGGDGLAEKTIRVAFANTDAKGLQTFAERWRAFMT